MHGETIKIQTKSFHYIQKEWFRTCNLLAEYCCPPKRSAFHAQEVSVNNQEIMSIQYTSYRVIDCSLRT